MKIVTVIGARPQFVKAAVVSRAIAARKNLQEVMIHTGQHYDKNMSDIFFTEMDIPQPSYNLAVKESLHGAMTAKMLSGIEEVLLLEKPALVLTYGDTNSTLAAALAASKLHIAIAHIEAGLRSFNRNMPEEINRLLTDQLSEYLFCPTDQAIANLQREGYEDGFHQIFRTGDVMLDAALYYAGKSTSTILQTLALQNVPYVLATIHRAENTNDTEKLRSIVEALNELNTSTRVLVPLHPRTTKILQQQNIPTEFTIIDPVGYFDMLQLLSNCAFVITDSGGLQKEAFFFKKFCVTLREQTEWVELVENGYAALAGSNRQLITSTAQAFLSTEFSGSDALYGDGNAGETIAGIIEHKLGST